MKKDHKYSTARRMLEKITALGIVASLAACGTLEQAVVTSDPLAQSTAVQDALERLDTGGKNYAYVWDAADAAASTQKTRESLERERENLLAQDPHATVCTDEEIEETLLKFQEMWKRQREAEYTVGPQEAADIAGTVMEELYGMDLSQIQLQLRCVYFGSSPQKITQEEVWGVEKQSLYEGDNNAFVGVSTTTGQILGMTYGASEKERDAMQQTVMPACMQRWEDDGAPPHYRFDPADASYPALENKLEQQIQELLSGSRIAGGAQVTHVLPHLQTEASAEGDGGTSFFEVYCDNGRTFHVKWNYMFPNYGFSGYPLRAFFVEDRTDL